ncbi:MAG: sulfotransferase domain-containing protein [Rubrivivax sp.]
MAEAAPGSGGTVWLASYPKSGSTWLRMFVRNLLADGERPADINAGDGEPIASHRPWLDGVLGIASADLLPAELERLRPRAYDWPAPSTAPSAAPSLRKIHDAYSVADDGSPLAGRGAGRRAVYIVRNPLAVAVSYAHHRDCSVDEAIDLMADPEHALAGDAEGVRGQVRQRLHSWSGHVRSWTGAPGLDLHLLRYEDMALQPGRAFRGVARFLGLPFDVARVAKAVRFAGFDELARQETHQGFRERVSANSRFFRSGRVDGWREVLTPAQVHRIVEQHAPTMARLGYLDGPQARRPRRAAVPA